MQTSPPNFTDFLHTALNTGQKEAVVQKNGIFLVCAGAGSGKTRVITARITNLILNENVLPYQIIALTFTNKAAREMKERVAHFMPHVPLPFVGTFHSYCLQLLKINRQLLATPEFTILDDDDQEKMLRTLINRFGEQKKITVKSLSAAISHIKNDLLGSSADPLTQQFYIAYEREKKLSHCFDFDDLLLEVLQLFRKNPEFKNQFQQRIRHILVDEYQDTNKVQHALLKEMTLDRTRAFTLDSLCTVGDEDQSIYSWRGANVTNMINFKDDFPTAQLITIEQNYRSVQPILEAANTIIQNNLQRNPKNLWSNKIGHNRIRLLECASGYQEGECVAQLAQQHFAQKPQETIAVLYRSHYQSRSVEEALIRSSTPYRIIGGIRFYNRQEIKDLLAYLRLAVNPFDRVSFTRAINIPARGLGEKFVEQFTTLWDAQPFLHFKNIAEQLLAQKELTAGKQAELQKFFDLYNTVNTETPAIDALNSILLAIKYISHLDDAYEADEARAKRENVKEFLHAVFAAGQRGTTSISAFLDEVALLQEQSSMGEHAENCIYLMTLHGAKGLEFDTVILTGLEEGILPSAHALYQAASVEEERRLLYVGITRARERLLLSHTQYRSTYGTMTNQRPSRFIKELPDSITATECAQWSTTQIKNFLREWYGGADAKIATQKTPSFQPAIPAIHRTKAIKQTVPNNTIWHLQQKVTHQKFGVGTIKKIECLTDTTTHLTIEFTEGTKKISAAFLQRTE